MSTVPTFVPPNATRDPRSSWLGVTTILKLAGLSPWQDVTLDMVRRGTEHRVNERTVRYILQGVYPEKLDAKAELGKMVHLAVHDIERGNIEPWWNDCDFAPYVEGYLKFKRETGYQAIAMEEQVFNDTYHYQGHLDSRGMMGECEALVDVKTIVRMGEHLAWQLAGYDLCLDPNPKRRRIGLQLKPDATFQIHEYKDRNDTKIFLAAVAIAHTKKGIE